MEFLGSEWFMWVVLFIIASSIFTIFYESFTDGQDLEWDVIRHYAKKVIGFILAMIFLPVVIVYGLLRESKVEKKKDS
jgi:uncharacterized membrane protein YedE/YeeE